MGRSCMVSQWKYIESSNDRYDKKNILRGRFFKKVIETSLNDLYFEI